MSGTPDGEYGHRYHLIISFSHELLRAMYAAPKSGTPDGEYAHRYHLIISFSHELLRAMYAAPKSGTPDSAYGFYPQNIRTSTEKNEPPKPQSSGGSL